VEVAMHRKNPIVLALVVTLFCTSHVSAETLQSTSFQIPTFVFSGAGGPMESHSFRIEATLGQSTPLMDPADPPYSESFDVYPGFWFTVPTAIGSYCIYDYEPDGDVDGKDLSEFIQDFAAGLISASDLEDFSAEFGHSPCIK
jgi:hypothetical protein